MKFYKVTKYDGKKEEWYDLGICPEEDVKAITKGYPFDGMVYTRKNSMTMFIVEEVENN